jgi:hypothetical protein
LLPEYRIVCRLKLAFSVDVHPAEGQVVPEEAILNNEQPIKLGVGTPRYTVSRREGQNFNPVYILVTL